MYATSYTPEYPLESLFPSKQGLGLTVTAIYQHDLVEYFQLLGFGQHPKTKIRLLTDALEAFYVNKI